MSSIVLPKQTAVAEVQGPLVRQPEPAARFARILHHAAQELWDICTYTDHAQMWEEARAIASRILAASGK
jgi:hypothetical protein